MPSIRLSDPGILHSDDECVMCDVWTIELEVDVRTSHKTGGLKQFPPSFRCSLFSIQMVIVSVHQREQETLETSIYYTGT